MCLYTNCTTRHIYIYIYTHMYVYVLCVCVCIHIDTKGFHGMDCRCGGGVGGLGVVWAFGD